MEKPASLWVPGPEGTRSFALLCIDPDAPTVPETVGRDDLQIPVEQPRGDFLHWTMVDRPRTTSGTAVGRASGPCRDVVLTLRGLERGA